MISVGSKFFDVSNTNDKEELDGQLVNNLVILMVLWKESISSVTGKTQDTQRLSDRELGRHKLSVAATRSRSRVGANQILQFWNKNKSISAKSVSFVMDSSCKLWKIGNENNACTLSIPKLKFTYAGNKTKEYDDLATKYFLYMFDGEIVVGNGNGPML
ncbi:unnamed protein product [Lactuca saligna]|uniref:Uncharacterized protein n=1 Tax=Lactuca saligna TaxID=75948 RepID=A0AA36EN47_LACSI|nr:unnamed protein product [Lactuca saligna]